MTLDSIRRKRGGNPNSIGLSNSVGRMRTDPFNINRLRYKSNNKRIAVIIPPESKNNILKELERMGISETYIYPEMDYASKEIKQNTDSL